MNNLRVITNRKIAQFIKAAEVFKTAGFIKVFNSLRNYIPDRFLVSIVLFFQKSLEKYEIELFKKSVKSGMTVVDIGANIGLYTVLASQLVGPKGKVIAFEPEPSNLKLLKKHVNAKALNNVIVVPKALSNSVGTIKLFKDGLNLGNHSISSKNLLVECGYVSVDSTTLDKYFNSTSKRKRVDIIKSDAQGAEGAIFSGGEKLLQDSKAMIIMEFWPDAIEATGGNPQKLLTTLKSKGYKIKLIDKLRKSLRLVDPGELIKSCKNRQDNSDYANLLLVK